MRKKILSVILIAVLAISSSLVACGNDKKADGETSKPAVSENEDANKEVTLESLFSDPVVSKQLKDSTPEDCVVTAKGNNLIYTFKQSTQVPVNDAFIDALKTGMEGQEKTFETLATALKTQVDGSEIKITFNFVNADDSEIYSHEVTY